MAAPVSKIVLTDRFETIFFELKEHYADAVFHRIETDDFLIEHAREAVDRASLTSDREKVIVLAANRFTPIAQNKLLKIIEEPPSKTHFILMTPSKSGLLATIRSRLPIENRIVAKEEEKSGVDLERFDLSRLFDLLRTHRRIDAKRAAALVENISKEAMRSGNYRLDEELLETFSQSVRLLDMGSPPNFVLARLGLKLLERKK
ncbi:DNA polymerase III subunit delta' [Hydrogenimonas urashimensis]|uniref:DNA polymerase III subunit delta' n=1 Tax=Hydrogenimonas urashimensis TaxID=2740515 RepID=UPI00191608E8|nr:DNA polymerase III subunit delta' [Hydrogenimonas urashimensis]